MLTGKGFFVWVIDRCEGGDPAAIAALAKAAGLEHVLIKIADGATFYNRDRTTGYDHVPAVVAALRKQGLAVWGWQYIYGYDPLGEARVAISSVLSLELDGFIVNAEAEYKLAGRGRAAESYMATLRTGLKDIPIGLSSYRFPSYHREFPWAQFVKAVDFVMPQVYWMGAHNPGYQLQRSFQEYQALQPDKVYIPTGAAFRESGWQPTFGEVLEFMEAAQSLGLGGVNFWEWGNTRKWCPECWAMIAEFDYGNPIVPPPPTILFQAQVATKTLYVRSGPGTQYKISGQLAMGDVVDVYGIDGQDTWVYVGNGRWAAMLHKGQRLARIGSGD